MFGQSQLRLEDDSLLRGQGRYTGDLAVKDCCYGVVVRSKVAHGSFKILNLDQVRTNFPGVVAIYTIADLDQAGLSGMPCMTGFIHEQKHRMRHIPTYPVLARKEVKFVGQPIAFVVAETLNQSYDAAEALDIEITSFDATVQSEDAVKNETVRVHAEAKNNLALEWNYGNKEQTRAILNAASHKVSLKIINNRLIANPMENRVCIGDWRDERYWLHTPSQGVHIMRSALTKVFGIDKTQFRVISEQVGGGFGNRTPLYPEHVLALFAARDLQRAVKWQGERSADGFVSDYHGRDNVSTMTIGFDADYKIVAFQIHTLVNLGAFFSFFSPFVATILPLLIQNGVYNIPKIFSEVQGVFTNTVPIDAYRGAGRPEAIYAIERMIDHAARELGVDRFQLRRLNMIRNDQLPIRNATGTIYDSGNFPLLLERAIEEADVKGFEERRRQSLQEGRYRGLGVCYFIECCGGGDGEHALISLNEHGQLDLRIGMQANGQGHRTSITQIINGLTGVMPRDILFLQGDSDRVERGSSTGGSRMLSEAGSVAHRVTEVLISNAKAVAEDILEASSQDIQLIEGSFFVAGTDRAITWKELADHCARRQISLSATDHYVSRSTFPNGCHICEVEIDKETCQWKLVSYRAVDDFGRILNPSLLAGQVHGGIAQGIGQAMLEHTVYDESGALLSGSLMDYTLPRADDMTTFNLSTYEGAPCPNNILGVKGAGEAGTIAATPVLVSAIHDALFPLGVKQIDMPATPYRIWKAIQEHA